MTQGRRIAMVLVAALTASASAAEASVVCDRLYQRLDASSAAGDQTDLLRYGNALTRQNIEIRKARQDMNRLGCSAGSIVHMGTQEDCTTLSEALQRMDENRRILADKIAMLRADGQSASRSRIEAALQAYDCAPPAPRPGAQETRSQSASLDPALGAQGLVPDAGATHEAMDASRATFGPMMPRALQQAPLLNDLAREQSRLQPPGFAAAPPSGENLGYGADSYAPGIDRNGTGGYNRGPQSFASPPEGRLRTLCVRTCDGGFFPISANASPLNFRRDEALCHQMCPGTETRLFYHALLNQESADMVAADTGEPYRNLPNAFAYLNRRPGEQAACGCNLSAYHRSAQQSQTATAPQSSISQQSSITEIHSPPQPGLEAVKPEAPQTAAPQTAAPALPQSPASAAPVERDYRPDNRTIRQVGPVFLPQETSSIDLRNPAGDDAQPLQ